MQCPSAYSGKKNHTIKNNWFKSTAKVAGSKCSSSLAPITPSVIILQYSVTAVFTVNIQDLQFCISQQCVLAAKVLVNLQYLYSGLCDFTVVVDRTLIVNEWLHHLFNGLFIIIYLIKKKPVHTDGICETHEHTTPWPRVSSSAFCSMRKVVVTP